MIVSPRACWHCGSPAKGNPCWWSIKYPESVASGGDPPCFGDWYDESLRERQRQPDIAIAAYSVLALIIAALIFFAI